MSSHYQAIKDRSVVFRTYSLITQIMQTINMSYIIYLRIKIDIIRCHDVKI